MKCQEAHSPTRALSPEQCPPYREKTRLLFHFILVEVMCELFVASTRESAKEISSGGTPAHNIIGASIIYILLNVLRTLFYYKIKKAVFGCGLKMPTNCDN